MRKTLAAALLGAAMSAHARSDDEWLTLMHRTVSLFECANLIQDKDVRVPYLEAGLRSGREFMTAFLGDRALHDRIWGNVDFAFFAPAPTIDFELGAAYTMLGDRITEGFKVDTWKEEVAHEFARRNCSLIAK